MKRNLHQKRYCEKGSLLLGFSYLPAIKHKGQNCFLLCTNLVFWLIGSNTLDMKLSLVVMSSDSWTPAICNASLSFSLAALLMQRFNLKSRILPALWVLSDTPCTLSGVQTDLFLLSSQFTQAVVTWLGCYLVFWLFVSFEIPLYFHCMEIAETYQHLKLHHPLLWLGLT